MTNWETIASYKTLLTPFMMISFTVSGICNAHIKFKKINDLVSYFEITNRKSRLSHYPPKRLFKPSIDIVYGFKRPSTMTSDTDRNTLVSMCDWNMRHCIPVYSTGSTIYLNCRIYRNCWSALLTPDLQSLRSLKMSKGSSQSRPNITCGICPHFAVHS